MTRFSHTAIICAAMLLVAGTTAAPTMMAQGGRGRTGEASTNTAASHSTAVSKNRSTATSAASSNSRGAATQNRSTSTQKQSAATQNRAAADRDRSAVTSGRISQSSGQATRSTSRTAASRNSSTAQNRWGNTSNNHYSGSSRTTTSSDAVSNYGGRATQSHNAANIQSRGAANNGRAAVSNHSASSDAATALDIHSSTASQRTNGGRGNRGDSNGRTTTSANNGTQPMGDNNLNANRSFNSNYKGNGNGNNGRSSFNPGSYQDGNRNSRRDHYSRYSYRNDFSPRSSHNDDRFLDHYRQGWRTPVRPPHRPWRPQVWFYARPTIPYGWSPYRNAPIIDGIIGLYFGTLYNETLNYLYYNNYYIDGYYDGIVYVRNVDLYGYTWPDVELRYDDYNGLNYAQFSYSMGYNDMTRYDAIYRQMCGYYGQPVAVVGGTYPRVTWVGGDSRGYITLSLNGAGGRWYTSLAFGY